MSMLKILRTSRALAVAAACIGIFTLGIQQAQAISLEALVVGGGTITVNDKLFDNWFLINNDGGFTLDQIDVTAIDASTDPDPLNPGPGLRYDGGGELRVEFDETREIAFSYRVSSLDPNLEIKDNRLELTLVDSQFNNSGAGDILIEEQVGDSPPNMGGLVNPNLGQKFVDAFLPGTGGTSLAELDFSPLSQIFVETDITLIVDGDPMDFVELSLFEQRFSQIVIGAGGPPGGGPPGGVIPEPGTLSLLGLGLVGLALHQWRRKKGASQ